MEKNKKKITLQSTGNKIRFSLANKTSKYSYSDDVKNGLAYYGKHNDLPQKYLSLLDDSSANSTSSTWHSIACEQVVKYVQGDGIVLSDGTIPTKFANNYGETYTDVFEACAWDYKLYGGFALEVIWDVGTVTGRAPKIAEIYQIPFKDIRAKEKNYRGKIKGWYVSGQWKRFKNAHTDPQISEYIPSFNPNAASYVEDEVNGVIQEAQPKQILVVKRHNPASEYYPEPDYKGALIDIVIDSTIRIFKLNKTNHDVAMNLIVQFIGEMDETTYEELAKDFEQQYQGAVNAGTPVLMNAATGADAHQFTTPNNAKGNAETYNSYIEDAQQRILSSHGITFKEIVGIDGGESLFADQKREKYATFLNTTIRDIQMPMLRGFNRLASYIFDNGEQFDITAIDLLKGYTATSTGLDPDPNETTVNQ